jgi:hypothetical protein
MLRFHSQLKVLVQSKHEGLKFQEILWNKTFFVRIESRKFKIFFKIQLKFFLYIFMLIQNEVNFIATMHLVIHYNARVI